MFFLHYLRFYNIQKFIICVKRDGWGAALIKLRTYIHLRQTDSVASAVPHKAQQQNGAAYLMPFWQEAANNGSFHILCAPTITASKRKIAMIGDLNLPQCRKYRVEQLAELWQRKGVDYEYAHYQDIPRCINIMQNATHLMLYRLQNNPLVTMYMYEARRLRLPILYDIDDPLFSVSAYETYGNMEKISAHIKSHFLNEAPKYLDVMNGADLISVATPELKGHAELYTARPVFIRRNFVDKEMLESGTSAIKAKAEHVPGRSTLRVAFASGSKGHEADFALIQDDMAEFLSDCSNRKLMILGHFDIDMLPREIHSQIETCEFTTYEQYLHNLAKADFAVLPLADDVFNGCKSAVRVMDANTVAVPAIVGNCSDMHTVVVGNETGIIIPDNGSWLDALNDMADTKAGIVEMGKNARKHIERNWAAKTQPPIIDHEIIDWVK